jgi:hypothetical protein
VKINGFDYKESKLNKQATSPNKISGQFAKTSMEKLTSFNELEYEKTPPGD